MQRLLDSILEFAHPELRRLVFGRLDHHLIALDNHRRGAAIGSLEFLDVGNVLFTRALPRRTAGVRP